MVNTIFTKNNRIIVHKESDLATKDNNITKHEVKKLAAGGNHIDMVLPLKFKLSDDTNSWTFPIEPLISISGKNVIVKRNVAKSSERGTIKERWAEDDYKITIQGKLEHPELDKYPTEDFQELSRFLSAREAIEVENELLALLNIHKIVIESYAFPFSKGENIQNFSIEAYSDNLDEVFMSVQNV